MNKKTHSITENKSVKKRHRAGLEKGRGRMRSKGRQINASAHNDVRRLLGGRKRRRDLLLEHLHLIQDYYGCLSLDHLAALAVEMRLSQSEVYEVATFYAHFDISKDSNAAPPEVTIRVCESLTCEMFDSKDILRNLTSINNKLINVVSGPCMGRCQKAPTVCVGKNYVDNATIDKVLKTIAKKEYQPVIPNYISFNTYKTNGGYSVFNKIVNNKISLDEIKNTVQKSNLKGKGGAGFPTFKKWEFVLANPEPRYLTINADEGEVGTFKDRYYLEKDPHRFLEGVLISAKIIKAKKIYIYLRDEYPAALEILKKEIQKLSDTFSEVTVSDGFPYWHFLCRK